MATLRQMVDGIGSLELNVQVDRPRHSFKAQQDVLIRRRVNPHGRNATTEVIVGRILAMGKDMATVSVAKPGGITQHMTVNLRDISPVTETFRRSSVQYSPAFRGRM